MKMTPLTNFLYKPIEIKVEEEISRIVSEENKKKVEEHFEGMSNLEGTINYNKMWDLRKRIFPKAVEPHSKERQR